MKLSKAVIMIRPGDYLIEDIINGGYVTALFQPLVYIKKKAVVGYSSFCPGCDHEGYEIDAAALVDSAERFGLVLQIDRLFRRKSLEGFSSLYAADRGMLLALNVNSGAIMSGARSGNFINMVRNAGIEPSDIIIELIESDIDETGVITDFAARYREAGFMIAIDESGCGTLNWDRVAMIKPDLVKLDSSMITGVAADFFKQEVLHSRINLAHKGGALVVAAGIDTVEDALKMMELGADILQGNYFSPPCRPEEISRDEIDRKIARISGLYRRQVEERRRGRIEFLERNMGLLDGIIGDMLKVEPGSMERVLAAAIKKYGTVECIYVLDDSGMQITGTVLNMDLLKARVSRIFHPDSIATDQSNKDYYLELLPAEESYVSGPYISAATGNVCVTASRRYRAAGGEGRILCVDISA